MTMSTGARTAGAAVVTFVLLAGALAGSAAEIPQRDAVLQPVAIGGGNLGSIRKIVFAERQPSRYYLLDRDTHAVREIAGGTTRLLGEIGNGPGELYYPNDLALAAAGDRLYVQDGGNDRIQILGADGRYLGEFPNTPKSQGLGVNRQGEVFIGQPATGELISVYAGGKKVRAFGELLSLSDLYGSQPRRKEAVYRTGFNRVRVAVDDEDNVWVAFVHAPIVCKFDRNGKLLAKTTLRLPELSKLTDAVLQQPPPKQYMSQNLDGVPMTVVLKEIVFDRHRRRPVLLLGDDRLVFLRRDGTPEEVVRVRVDGGVLATLAADNDGAIFTSKFATSKLFRVVLVNR